MLAILNRDLDVWTSVAPAEDIPLPDQVVDVVVCAQAFHWFDLDRASRRSPACSSPAAAWRWCGTSATSDPWVRRLGALLGTQDQLREPAEPLVQSRSSGSSRTRRSASGRRSTGSRSRTWCSPARTSPCSTRRAGPPRSPRSSRSTTTTAGAWTACCCPTSPAAFGPSSSTGRGARTSHYPRGAGRRGRRGAGRAG